MTTTPTVPASGVSYTAPAVTDVPAAAPAAATADACRNCGEARHGAYCSHCGQHFLEDRLTFRLLAAEAWERITFERGFLRTLWEMTIRPGVVVRRYVSGQRRRYVSPFTYLVVGAALSLVVLHLFDEAFAVYLRQQVAATGVAARLAFTPAQTDAYVRAYGVVVEQTTYTSLVVGVLYALLLRLLFRRSGVNLAEASVFALFTFGHVYFVDALVSLATIPTTGDMGLSMGLTLPLYLVVTGLAAAQYFGRPLWTVVKNSVAVVVAFGLFSVLAMIAMALYAVTR
ncbi:MAG TPA: DUF3667 domain-containing protein [Gemmatimonadaceae bacterium]|nr:DUF3667 domain-containing protein [Gemmatimonadaceae bacterium]